MTDRTSPTIELSGGVQMPALGLGVFSDAARGDARRRPGRARGRLPADRHRNEREVGEAMHASGVERGEVFLETKVCRQASPR